MKYTISTHNGSAVSRQHNLRNPKVVSKEEHIRVNGHHETWVDEDPRKVYDELFGKAQKEYNERQIAAGRPNRCIDSYYNCIAKSPQKHIAYEMIIAIGSKHSSPDVGVAKEIMHDFVDRWPERNSSLKLVGAYYHNDEQGCPHTHISYIPYSTNYKNGLSTQTGLVRALKDIGFVGTSSRDTAQIQWQRRENQVLEKLCRDRGLEIEHPLEEGRRHLATEDYKLKKELANTRAMLEAVTDKLKSLQNDYESLEEKYKRMLCEGNRRFAEYKAQIDLQKAQIEDYKKQLEAYEAQIANQKKIFEVFGGDSSTLANYNSKLEEPEEESIDFEELIGDK